jgi:O-antigen/teichoic acid export membrane protein
MSIESLAVLPVVDSFVFLFRSFGFSYQEVGIALLGEHRQHLRPLRRVGVGIAVVTTGVLVLVTATPAVTWLYQGMYGLRPELAAFAVIPTMILVPLPALAVAYSLQRAILISARRSVAVTWSTIVEVGLIAVVMAILVSTVNPVGVIAAATAMIVGRLVANVYLVRETRRVLR